MLLAAITQIGGEVEARVMIAWEMIASERRFAGVSQFGARARRIGCAALANAADQRAYEIVTPLRHQHAERREIAGKLGHDDARDRYLAPNGGGVKGARATEGDQRRVARVDSPVDRDGAH